MAMLVEDKPRYLQKKWCDSIASPDQTSKARIDKLFEIQTRD